MSPAGGADGGRPEGERGRGRGRGRPEGEHEVKGVAFRDEGGGAAEAAGVGSAVAAERLPRRVTWLKVVLMPAVLAVVLLGTWVWFRSADLDSIAQNALADGNVWLRFKEHVELTAISTFFVLIIAIPLGILLTRPGLRRAAPAATMLANIGQATPAIGLLALLVIWLGIGKRAALIGMIIYAVLPVLSNTIAGLRANDPTLLEAARGIGMSRAGVLAKVELPLAVPLILAGVRTALVLNVGTATLAAFGGGGGLGDLITTGITTQRMPVLVLGSLLTVALALFVDWLASLVELLLRPRGLEVGA
ncbi:ABC transporter permease [Streptomyces sp. NPDC021093]|uniref:ABC transporter permease n=1 Tax=Streptomyces sp. NPDC021093 TaxID=3365112 RepID=UPI0037920518